MSIEMDARADLVKELKEIFRSDRADLDFGIYRILNYKRDKIERFIEEDLVQEAEKEFSELMEANIQAIKGEVDALKKEINRDFGKGTIDEWGNVTGFRDAPKIQEYIKKKEVLEDQDRVQGHIEDVFNHVYGFFNRYYDKGDFISQRKFGGREKYVIPYKGEEVYLYWANQNQYYVKTGTDYKKYSFKLGQYRIVFKLIDAEVPKNNNMGDDLFYLLRRDRPIRYSPEEKQLEVFFEHRALTEEDIKHYELKESSWASTKADNILEKNHQDILDNLKERKKLHETLIKSKHTEDLTKLRYNLMIFTNKNERDYFVHDDLGGFLRRELDFYLKNEVHDITEFEESDPKNIKLLQSKIRAIKNLSSKVIAFLEQIEKFQKTLFEKKKFVLRADYCMTLDNVPEQFYPEIAENEEQVREWKELYKLDEITENTLLSTKGKQRFDIEYLKSNRFLVLDTRFFPEDFKKRLLSTFNNLDERIDGLLIKSDNFHALNLIRQRFKGKIKCIYIDPPFNTGKDEFLYKDGYRHASWITMLQNRLKKSLDLLGPDGVFVSHIDEHEVNSLSWLVSMLFGEKNFLGTVVWDKRNPKGDARGIASQHEYLLYASKNAEKILGTPSSFMRPKENMDTILSKARQLYSKIGKRIVPDSMKQYVNKLGYSGDVVEKLKISYTKEKANEEFKTWLSMQDFSGGEKAYNSIDENGRVYQAVSMAWPGTPAPKEYYYDIIHPKTGKPCPVPAKGWRYKRENMEKFLKRGEIQFGPDETTQPRRKYFLDEFPQENFPSVIYYGGDASNELSRLGLEFSTAKPLTICEQVLQAITSDNDIIVDYFAGSGSVAHAIINLNRKDSGQRKCILIEVGDYFETIMIPRIKKVIFSREWKDGVPVSDEGTSQIFKYLYLEQYEDSLNNIIFATREGKVQERLESFSDYFLRYMLFYETKDSPTRVTIDRFKTPFDYKITTLQGTEEKTETVDLVETFNYLLGIKVKRIKQYENEGTRYLTVFGEKGEEHQTEKLLVIWRNFEGLDLEKDKQFIENSILSEFNPDIIYLNVDSYIKGAQSIEPRFKELMGVQYGQVHN